MKTRYWFILMMSIASTASAERFDREDYGILNIDGERVGVVKNRYGHESFKVDFVLTKSNSAMLDQKYLPKYGMKAPKSLECGKGGAEFYIRHDAISFAVPPNFGRYYIVRTGGAALADQRCERLAEVWSRGKPLRIELIFDYGQWKYSSEKNRLVTTGGSNNIYAKIGAVVQGE
uniref:hypothetical protein n=1 Tax=Burkholderia diffusa TaxID=488732 RepID=UPI001CC59BAF|nr:hypothetical protein [Burkholderia diffusa]